jgi:hypothetical protein
VFFFRGFLHAKRPHKKFVIFVRFAVIFNRRGEKAHEGKENPPYLRASLWFILRGFFPPFVETVN